MLRFGSVRPCGASNAPSTHQNSDQLWQRYEQLRRLIQEGLCPCVEHITMLNTGSAEFDSSSAPISATVENNSENSPDNFGGTTRNGVAS